MKIIRWISAISSVALTASMALAATAPGTTPPATKLMSQKVLNANAWTIYTTNYGPMVKPQPGSGGGFWRNPAHGYIYGAGLWVGAQNSSGTKIVAMGYNPSSGSSEFGPVSMDESYQDYLTDPFARVYLSTDPTDYYDWPVLDGGKKIIKSRQDSYCKYSDENPQFTTSGDSILRVVVDQHSYAWNYADNNDIVFFYFKVKNKSGIILDSVYIGPCVDADIGNEADGPTTPNDRTLFDYTRNLAMQYQTIPEVGWDAVGVVGFRYFESPINNTGNTVNVVDNQFPHSIPPGWPLGMTAFKILLRAGKVGDPATDAEAYAVMEGYDFITWDRDGYDEWGADQEGDKRFVMSSGPFVLKPDSVVTTCIGIIGALDTVKLKAASDVAQTIYDNGFALADAPASPAFAFTATAGDGKAYLSWNKAIETTPDPYWEKLDSTKKWYYYFPGSWLHLPPAGQALVDSFLIKTSDITVVTIPRGAANPVGGTDTLLALYNQKAMYEPYDFQGYLLYRADHLSDLNDPAKRVNVGTLSFGSSGAHGYFYDKADGVQIVIDTEEFVYVTPGGTYYLPIYDTLGTDRGLIYGLIDNGLTNGHCYYYGISAYDYQPNVYFTRKSPTTLASDPVLYAQPVIPAATPGGYIPPNITIRVDGGSDSRYGGALDYFENLQVANPKIVPNDSFKLHWGAMKKYFASFYNYPVYSGYLFNSSDVLIDSVNLQADYNQYSTNYYGTPHDEMPFGGIVFKPYLEWSKRDALIDSLQVIETPGGVRTYPKDSIFTLVDTINTFRADRAQWQWRGSDIEIRWRDSIGQVGTNPSGNILTCTVWDITNNVEVPWEGGLTKANMTKSAWCFNPLSASSGTYKYIDSTMTAGIGMHIAGVTMYFKRFGGVGTASRMSWPNRPETGDIWKVYCSGPTTPSEGSIATFIMTPEASGVEGKPGVNVLSFLLSQNAPNPFGRSGTNISYQIGGSGSSPVSLKIYNITGQLVKTLVDDYKTPGRYNAVWDGRSDKGQKVSAGIYIYRLQAGEKNITRKMVLIR
jgi:hypothetical protein